jgi:serine/threonine protein kinase
MAQALSQDPPPRAKEEEPKEQAEPSNEVVFESEEFQTKKCDLESSDGSVPATFAREAAAKLIGQTVNGQYQIVSAIGYGGMSVVFRAKDLKLGKFVALKMLLPHLMMQSHSMARFQQEAQSASALNHPHVVSIHNYGETESGQPFLVMDLIEGSSLSTLIKKEGQLPVDRALNIFIQLASALSHAHQKGIVHRDLKPSNVLLTEQNGETDFCKIVDFGIAKLLPHEGRDAVSLTQTGDVFGSPLYMSPEQCKGEKLDAKADIYSMGCLMYESLSGTPPHFGNNMLEVLYRHMNEVPKDFKSLKRGIIVPQRLEATIFKALAKEPAARHQSMQALHDELKQILLFRKTSLVGRLATSWELFVLKRRPRKRSEFIILGALVLSLLGLFSACAYLVSQYAFADESQVFKQALDWRTPPLPPPANVGETAISLYQNDIDNASSILKDSPDKMNSELLQHVTLWGTKMGDANRWEEAQKAYSIALELSRLWNGELCLPTLTLRRQYAEACYFAKDYAFAAREFTLYQQHVRNFLYGEKVPATLKGIVQTAESYYYLHQYSDAITAYRNLFASMHGEGLEWTHWGYREIGNYVEEARRFQSTEGYALVLSHVGDCFESAEVWQRAKDHYKDAAARWHLLKSYDNEALAYLKIAAIEEKLNENPTASYEAALKALKPGGSLLATCIVEKRYADYLWKHGNAIQAILLKLEYSREVPKVKL